MYLDPRSIIHSWLNNESIESRLSGPHDYLRVAESALSEDIQDLIEYLVPNLSTAENEILNFRRAQLGNDAEAAQTHLANALTYSRNSSSRDHILEARIRMEWGVLRSTLDENEIAGTDLKWAMERFSALEEGHPWHGIACLNMAEWHRARNEWGMSLAIHSSISRHGPHQIETIAMSRRMAADIYVEIGQMMNALRNMWISFHGFQHTGLMDLAVESGLQWLDLGLAFVESSAPLMDTVVENSTPRSHQEKITEPVVNLSDVKSAYNWICDNLENRSGLNRPDLHVLADTADMLGVEFNTDGIQDQELLKRYQ
ncbi:MAG: hypothetical protein QF440_00785 [Candidatus Thalassarchaeaceae archaeon]|jgi:hypothetical protein|nr:hypothetical protein [Candidatus Thalassarchaeaceae archaeon]